MRAHHSPAGGMHLGATRSGLFEVRAHALQVAANSAAHCRASRSRGGCIGRQMRKRKPPARVQLFGTLHSNAKCRLILSGVLMKISAIVFVLVSAGAHAQTTINLESAPCGAGVWCASVPNDSGDSILLYGSTNYQNVGVIVGQPDGVFLDFVSQSYRGYSTVYVGACPASPAVGTIQLTSVPMTGYNGTKGGASVTATFSCTSVLGRSGRGAGWHQIWNLINGQLTLP